MRLIDADATIKYLREFRCKDCDRRKGMKNGKIRFCYEIGEAPCRACDIGDAIDYFLDEDISPTIDAVQVVRCKDCRWGEPTKNAYDEDRIICGNDATYIDRYITVPANWFCADGERKEDR